jgi:dipeptidyl aminopeptidase/acylaminoacyl peptidase
MRTSLYLFFCLLAAAPAAASTPSAPRTVRGSEFLPDGAQKYLKNADVKPIWLSDSEFAYRRDADGGRQWVIADTKTGRNRPAFDQKLVAAGLAKATGKPIEPGQLPFESFAFTPDAGAIRVGVGADVWVCSLAGAGQCTAEPSAMVDKAMGSFSPDRRWIAYVKDGNLRIRAADGSSDRALTTDAVADWVYAGSTGNSTSFITVQRAGIIPPPNLRWSPDSRRILTNRIDERGVKPISLLQNVPEDGSLRPKTWTWRYSMPGEPDAMQQLMIFDVATGARTDVQLPPERLGFMTAIELSRLWWAADSARVWYANRIDPHATKTILREINASTGAVRDVLTDSAQTYVEQGPIGAPPMIRETASGDIIWYSAADGYGHLYRYDGKTGRLRNRITSGPWMVRELVRVDEAGQRIFFTASGREKGRNPYFRKLYSVGYDGRGLKLLTPEDAEHSVAWAGAFAPDPLGLGTRVDGVSPDAGHFVDTFSRPDLLPTSKLRRADGTVVATLEQGRLEGLDVPTAALPETFELLAADGKTKLYGLLFRPLNFDPSRKYPLVDAIYAAPQARRVSWDFGGALFGTAGMLTAQNGMVTIVMDARGTPDRSQAFLMHAYGKLANPGLDDHVAVIRQLAQRYPFIDLDRVGMWGVSGGGFATARAMFAYPDFFKVGVSNAGNHDIRGYVAGWAEIYQGPDVDGNYAAAANQALAANLKGKLLLIHGEMDDNVHPAHTMRVVDALIKADKDFDLLIVPNANHGSYRLPYVWRRTVEYLAHNLGAEPVPEAPAR